ncbi:RNA-binding protein [Prochlorococcus sp. AH-716-K03]|nr:RNA-binding protein [Prochlorococcus sp. AH-716-K03]
MTIFIGNLSWDTEEEDLEDLFNTYGEVRKCTIPLDRDSGKKRGFAFVEMNNDSLEKNAINDLQDVEWMGREIRVYQAKRIDRSPRGNRSYYNKK